MDVDVLLSNIDRLIKAQKTTQNAVSDLAGKRDAIRNLRRGSSWTLEVLDAVATALGVSAWELMRPPGAVPKDEEFREFVRGIIREETEPPKPAASPRKRKTR